MHERGEADDRGDESGYARQDARQGRPKGEKTTAVAPLLPLGGSAGALIPEVIRHQASAAINPQVASVPMILV